MAHSAEKGYFIVPATRSDDRPDGRHIPRLCHVVYRVENLVVVEPVDEDAHYVIPDSQPVNLDLLTGADRVRELARLNHR